MPIHRKLIGEQLHRAYSFEYADAAARELAVGFNPSDIGKDARQLDDNSRWTLVNNAPIVWMLLGGDLIGQQGAIVQMKSIQTRAQGTFSAPTSGNGTEVTPLNIVITPRKAGNAMVLEWHVNGKMHQNTVYIVQRDGVLLADTTNASNNRWAGVMAHPYDAENASTLENAIVRITDFNTLATPTTYSLHIRASGDTPYTLFLNRTEVSDGTDNHATSISTGTATEIQQ